MKHIHCWEYLIDEGLHENYSTINYWRICTICYLINFRNKIQEARDSLPNYNIEDLWNKEHNE